MYTKLFMVVIIPYWVPSLQQWTLSEIILNYWFYTEMFRDRYTFKLAVHQRALLRPTILWSKNKVIFIVAGPCAKNMQILKEIHGWADLEFTL